MNITNSDILEYQQLYQTKFGIVIDYQQAAIELRDVVGLMLIAYQPMTKEDLERIQSRRKELGL